MPSNELVWSWFGRIFAIFVALLALGLILPNIGPEPSTIHQPFPDKVAVLAYVGITILSVIFIFVGHKRSRVLTVVGWLVLVALLAAAFLK